jgi:hypothetical protein
MQQKARMAYESIQSLRTENYAQTSHNSQRLRRRFYYHTPYLQPQIIMIIVRIYEQQ